mmetsp:Transcript_23642/g.57977  ORF Transcript_23642/g.57977 Transcript_23642/m.57977 type:complete len:378 (+) Transcript_23642:285-1418(+)
MPSTNDTSLGIQRLHRRVIADHPYTRRNQIVSNIVKGGKCLFQGDFATCLLQVNNRSVTEEVRTPSRIKKEQKIRDTVLLQGNIYSKTILLEYTESWAARHDNSGEIFKNPAGNGQTFTLEDIENAPCALTGKELVEYAMRCTGEDDNAIFLHEVKIILARDLLGTKLEDDKVYTLFWYVSALQQASNRWVENAEEEFSNHLHASDRNTQVGIRKWFFGLLIKALLFFLEACSSKLVSLGDLSYSYSSRNKHGLEEANEDASAAKEELMAKNEELKRSNEMIKRLQRANGNCERCIGGLKASVEALERRQEELVYERDMYQSVARRVENVTRIHRVYMDSFNHFSVEAGHLQTELERQVLTNLQYIPESGFFCFVQW